MSPRPEDLRSAERETRQITRRHSENFVVASCLLPRRLHQPFCNVYAFCRTADDLADQSGSPRLGLQQLDAYQSQLDQAFLDPPGEIELNYPIFVALSDTVRQFGLTQEPFDDLLDAFRQDQNKTRYATIEELNRYCQRSANPVGRIVLKIAGCLDDENARYSDSVCTGLQRVNILQDLARDYELGRIYLPLDQMRQFKVTDEMFGMSVASPQLRMLVESECSRAEQLLREGSLLIRRVPAWLAGDIRLFVGGGLEAVRAIRNVRYDVLQRRPTVSPLRTAILVFRSLLGRVRYAVAASMVPDRIPGVRPTRH